MVSFLHALVCIWYGSYHYLYANPPVCGAQNTVFQRRCLVFSMSYFIYDTLAMCYDGLMDTAMAIHHPLCVFAMFLPLLAGTQGNYVMIAVYITELSNPAMTARHILRLSGRRYTYAYELCEITFLALYMWSRAITPWAFVYNVVTCDQNHFGLKLSCIGVTAQSVFFVNKMRSLIVRRYREIMYRRKLGIQYHWFTPLDKDQIGKLNM